MRSLHYARGPYSTQNAVSSRDDQDALSMIVLHQRVLCQNQHGRGSCVSGAVRLSVLHLEASTVKDRESFKLALWQGPPLA